MDLALNNLQRLICHKTKPTKSNLQQYNLLEDTKEEIVMIKALDCNIKVSEFELQLYYCLHFWTNTYGKVMKFLIALLFFYKDGSRIK